MDILKKTKEKHFFSSATCTFMNVFQKWTKWMGEAPKSESFCDMWHFTVCIYSTKHANKLGFTKTFSRFYKL